MKHPLNIAYEAATVDLKDVNMIDSFHFDAYNKVAVNYNRDVETFPVIKRIIEKITGKESVYQSPTDMGVNRVDLGSWMIPLSKKPLNKKSSVVISKQNATSKRIDRRRSS